MVTPSGLASGLTVFAIVLWGATFCYARYVERDADDSVSGSHRLTRWTIGVQLVVATVGGALVTGRIQGDIAPEIPVVASVLSMVVACLVLIGGTVAVCYPSLERLRETGDTVRERIVNPVLEYGLLFGKLATIGLVLLYGPNGTRALTIGVLWAGYAAIEPTLARVLNGGRSLPDDLRERCERVAADCDVSVRRWWLVPEGSGSVIQVGTVGALPGRADVFLTEYAVERLDPDELDRLLVHGLVHVRRGSNRARLLRLAAPGLLTIAVLEYASLSPSLALVLTLGWVVYYPLFCLATLRDVYAADAAAATHLGTAATADLIERTAEHNEVHRESSLAYDLIVATPSVRRRLSALEESSS